MQIALNINRHSARQKHYNWNYNTSRHIYFDTSEAKLSPSWPKSRIKRRVHNHFINGHKIQFVQAYCGLNIKDSCEWGTKRDNERDDPPGRNPKQSNGPRYEECTHTKFRSLPTPTNDTDGPFCAKLAHSSSDSRRVRAVLRPAP